MSPVNGRLSILLITMAQFKGLFSCGEISQRTEHKGNCGENRLQTSRVE